MNMCPSASRSSLRLCSVGKARGTRDARLITLPPPSLPSQRLLTFPKVCVNAHISGGAGEALVFSVRDVLVCLGINVLFSKAKVDDVDDVLVGGAIATKKEVLWLHVTIDQVFAVHILNSCNL